MFRELIRQNRKLDNDACIALLKNETRGVLSVLGDNDYPYAAPMNHFYNEEDGCIYFHCGRVGHRLDALRKHDKVCFCVHNQGERLGDNWFYTVHCAVIFGRMEIIDDRAAVEDITTRLSYKFIQDADHIRKEIEASAHKTLLLKLIPEHISGKWVQEE